jgi:hypothetical protein
VRNSDSAHPDPLQASEDAGHKTVRRATIADAVTVRELTRAAYAKWVPLLGREPRPMTADYDAAVRDHLIDLLHGGGEAVALLEVAPKADHLLSGNVAVGPAQQGRGSALNYVLHSASILA